MFLNEYEIEDAAEAYVDHPVLGPATRTLLNLMRWTNDNSDGWPYWRKPGQAALALMTLISPTAQSHWDEEREDATPEALKSALRPIKTFRTRHSATFDIVETLEQAQPQEPSRPADVRVLVLSIGDIKALAERGSEFRTQTTDGQDLIVRIEQ